LGIIRSKLDANDEPDKRAEASIPIYGLNRVDLVLARRAEALDLQSIFLGLLRAIESFTRKNLAGENTDTEREEFLFHKSRFRARFTELSPYQGLKQFLLEDFKTFKLVAQLNLNVEDLLKD
jgi:hypothetical protein